MSLATHAAELTPLAVLLDMAEALTLEATQWLRSEPPDGVYTPVAKVKGAGKRASQLDLYLASVLNAAVPRALNTPSCEDDARVLLQRLQGVAQGVSQDDAPSLQLHLSKTNPMPSTLPTKSSEIESSRVVARNEMSLAPRLRDPDPKVLFKPANRLKC